MQGTTVMFDILIVNLDVFSYLRMMPEKDLIKSEKEKKYFYLLACLECRRNFNSMVYSAERITGVEA